ncbi:MAG: MBL fold metallo-hydrolase [Clostridia bacterium]|nr:MBL fold metallo-hydrolase [Clostridia bacterium]
MKRRLFLALLVLSLLFSLSACKERETAPAAGEIRVQFIDVGEGDCILIRTAEATVLVDTGEAEERVTDHVLSVLQRQGVTSIDCLVLTHPHTDHIGGAAAVLEAFEVDDCLMPFAILEGKVFDELLNVLEASDTRVIEGYEGRSFTYGDLSFTLLSPKRQVYEDLNDRSIVMRVVFDELSLMLTGDATALAEAEILESYSADALASTLIKVGHHGAATSLSEEFLAAVAPRYAVISCGEGNAYGHPHAETLLRLRNARVAVFRTDKNGDITLCGNGKEFYKIK